MKNVHTIKDEVSKILQEKIGITPVKTSLHAYPSKTWAQKASQHLLRGTSLKGVNLIPNQVRGTYHEGDFSAFIPEDLEDSVQIMYHEYFGHGLQTEYTPLGSYIHTLGAKWDKELEEANISTNDMLLNLMLNSQTYAKIRAIDEKTVTNCEGLALWTGWYISSLRGEDKDFEDLVSYVPEPHVEACVDLIRYSKKYGTKKMLEDHGYKLE